jgi:histidine phosphotransferase ChpT
MARGFIEDEKTKLTWNLERLLLPKNKVKLLLNMLVIATQTIPRGGLITVDPIGSGDAISFKVTTTGTNIRVPPALPPLLAGTNEAPVDAQGIQAHYTGLLASSCDLKVDMTLEGESVIVTAQ